MEMNFYKIAYFFIAIWIIIEIFIIRWMFQIKPEKEITNKYHRKIVFLSQLPFGKGWKKHVDKADIAVLERYQFRIKIWYLSIMIPFFTILLIFLIKDFIDLLYWKARINF